MDGVLRNVGDGRAAGRLSRLDRRELLRLGGAAGLSLLAASCGGGDDGSGSSAGNASAGNGSTGNSATGNEATPVTPTTPATPKFGANVYDLFYLPFITSGTKFDPAPRLQQMKDSGMAFVRFSASPFWPVDWDTYAADTTRFFTILDTVFDQADRIGMPLVPGLLWNPSGLSDHLGERYSAWGNATSKCRTFVESYVPQIVSRYKGRSSLLMWELAGEMNIWADLPGSETYFPPVDTGNGTFAARTADDRISGTAVQDTLSRLSTLVRGTGDTHPISSGNGIPRGKQYNNAQGILTDYDTTAQFAQVLAQGLLGSIDTLSIHIYPDLLVGRFGTGATPAQVLTIARQVADAHSAKLFLGEFSVPRSSDTAADKAAFATYIAAAKAAKADYSAFWVYDYFDADDQYNVTTTNDRSWILTTVAAANS